MKPSLLIAALLLATVIAATSATALAQIHGDSTYTPLYEHTSYPDYYPCQSEEDGKWGYVDVNNQWVIEPDYDGVLYETNGGMYAVQRHGKWGFVGVSGEPLTEVAYDAAVCEIDYRKAGNRTNFAALRKRGKWAFIDVQGHFVTDFKYDEVLIMNGKYIVRVKKPDNRTMRSGELTPDGKEHWELH